MNSCYFISQYWLIIGQITNWFWQGYNLLQFLNNRNFVPLPLPYKSASGPNGVATLGTTITGGKKSVMVTPRHHLAPPLVSSCVTNKQDHFKYTLHIFTMELLSWVEFIQTRLSFMENHSVSGCLNALGLLFSGASIASTLGKGFLAIRKAGHLCIATQSQPYRDYSGREKTMEVRLDVLRPG